MNKNLILIAAGILMALTAHLSGHAQNINFKVGGGISATTTDGRPTSSFMAGAAYEYEFSQHWGVSPGLFLQSKGWRAPDIDVIYDQSPEDWNEETLSWRTGKMGAKSTINYIVLAVPFNYYIRTQRSNYLILSAGPFAAYGVKSKFDIKGDPSVSGGDRIGYSRKGFSDNGIRQFDAGLQAQVAFQFLNGITVGLQCDYSALNMAVSGAARRNIVGQLTLSYNFHRGNTYRQQIIDQLWQNFPAQ